MSKTPYIWKIVSLFPNRRKTARAAHCAKSGAMNKVIGFIIDIESFEKKCVILKGVLHSELLKQYMVIIEIYQSLRNKILYGHICLGNIHKLYKSSETFEDQKHYKGIIESDMVSTTAGFTDNSPISPGPSVKFKKPSARKSLHQFSEVLDVKNKTCVCRLGAAK